jgi:hypothetical protein
MYVLFFDLVAMAKKEKHKTTHPKIGKDQRWCAFKEHILFTHP